MSSFPRLSGLSSAIADTSRIPEPPEEVLALGNHDLETFWYLSKFVRDVLTTQECLDKITKDGVFPYFCMFNDGCKQFATPEKLEKHFSKNEAHRHDMDALAKRAEEVKNRAKNSLARRLGFARSPSASSTSSSVTTGVSRSRDREVRAGSSKPRSRSRSPRGSRSSASPARLRSVSPGRRKRSRERSSSRFDRDSTVIESPKTCKCT